MKFTDKYVQKLKPQEKRFEVLEGDGFTLRVTPGGVKTFYYVYKSSGKNRRLQLGVYPHCSLAEARDKHRAAVSQRHNGVDPVEEKRQERQERLLAPTVRKLSEEYMEKHAKAKKRSWRNDEQIFDKDVLPAWGDRKAADIRKRDVILLLESIVERGAPNQSGQVLKIIRKMFNWAVERDILEASPCHLVKPLAPAVSKDRALSAAEIQMFWRLLDSVDVRISNAMRCCLRLTLVTGQRPGECLGMMPAEVDGPWWTIPAERVKNGREHRVWLGTLALELIGDLAEEQENMKEAPLPVFANKDGEVMDKAAPSRATRRLTMPTKGQKTPRLSIPPFTPHDLRRTCATHLGGLGYDNEQIGRLLNHVDGTVTAIYNRHRYDDLIREMLQAWETRLREILAA